MNLTDYEISDDRSRMDIVRVQEMLSRTSWSPGISAEELQKGIDHSVLVVGVYHPEFGQIGFMRVLSDTIRFAYIMDVVIDERFRRQGLGQKMVSHALDHPSLSKVYRWLLATSDAHGVYQKLGFRPLAKPDIWMMIDKGIPQFPREM
jgi:ribosomal protein S18 acetylase RimI-like enzyme